MERPVRRTLEFRDLDHAVRDAESLLTGGYRPAGNWNLAQVCRHLSDWMSYPLDGYPRPPAPLRLMFWAMRRTIGPRALRKTLETKSMRAGTPTLRQTVPPPSGDDAAAVERFRQTVERFKMHSGPFHPSPFFGELDRDSATRLQLVHCAHHLSFLVPKNA